MADSFQGVRLEVAVQDLDNVDEIDWVSLDEYGGRLGKGQKGELY